MENIRETAEREVGWGSVYPLAGVLLDVHGLDERLQEAEKIGDPHPCAHTIESQLISIGSWKYWIGISDDWGRLEEAAESRRGRNGGMLQEARSIESLTGLEVPWVPQLARHTVGGSLVSFGAHRISFPRFHQC